MGVVLDPRLLGVCHSSDAGQCCLHSLLSDHAGEGRPSFPRIHTVSRRTRREVHLKTILNLSAIQCGLHSTSYSLGGRVTLIKDHLLKVRHTLPESLSRH